MFKLTDLKKEKIAQEVEFQYSRSSGPGGQKVNKTESRAELFWNLGESSAFKVEQKALIAKKMASRLNREGCLHFYSDQYRTRLKNKSQCLENLYEALEKALTIPKSRKKTKPTKASIEKRIQEKKRQSDKKKMRQKWD